MKYIKYILTAWLSLSLLSALAEEKTNDLETVLSNIEKQEFLDVDDAFQLSADVIGDEVALRWNIAPGYYLYNHQLAFKVDGAVLTDQFVPSGMEKDDPYFGLVEVYYKHLEVGLLLTEMTDELTITFKYQGCADAGLCYVPETKEVTFRRDTQAQPFASTETGYVQVGEFVKGSLRKSTSTTTLPSSDTDTVEFAGERELLAEILSEGDLLWIALVFFGAGLLLTFTPCVLPMIPILSSIIAGQGKDVTTFKAFKLSATYVLAMATTYALFGIAVAQAGGALSGYLQAPVVLFFVAGLFIVLSLSMFGMYELQLPQSLQDRLQSLNSKQQGGEYISVIIMGVLATLVVSPCTSAPLAAALLLIAQKGDVMTGGFALFLLGLGMGLPLILIGMGGGKWLPKAGVWMDKVKAFFGYMLLGLALYITSHLQPGFIYLGLWSILLVHAAWYFGAFRSASGVIQNVGRIFALGVFALGLVYMTGAFLGNSRLDNPLDGLLSESNLSEQHLEFKKFKTKRELDILLQTAAATGRPVMLDFFAEWCVACYEFEDYTFKDRDVQRFLQDKNVLLLQADVTENNSDDTAIMAAYQVLGLPTILLFDKEGKELTKLRATGYEEADVFLQRLQSAFR